MYILKTKGTNKIPDFIQIRDEGFALMGHIHVKQLAAGLDKLVSKKVPDTFIKELESLPYGVIKKLEI
ncbi:MAG: hypothetical protein R6U66_09955 [Bacteroidales bacterium]|jgi:hypothetical protein